MQFEGADAAPHARRRRFAAILDRDWLFALSLAFAVGVLVWFGRSIKDFFAPTAATVFLPAFAGQTQADARNECRRITPPGRPAFASPPNRRSDCISNSSK